jgi:hypothetical protein
MAKMLLAAVLLTLQDVPAEVKRALSKLEKSPEDESANAVVGRYYLAAGDVEKALEHLKKGSDETLRAAAVREEKAQEEKGSKLVDVGDLWILAMAKNRAIRQALLDRASFWYAKAWPDLDDSSKSKLRERLSRFYASPVARKALGPLVDYDGPVDVSHKAGTSGERVHSGNLAAKLIPGANAKNARLLFTRTVEIRGSKRVEYSIWVLSDGTDSLDDHVRFYVSDEEGKLLNVPHKFIGRDVPIWRKITLEIEPPKEAARANIEVVLFSKTGVVYVDDLSIKADGRELLKNGGFEEK